MHQILIFGNQTLSALQYVPPSLCILCLFSLLSLSLIRSIEIQQNQKIASCHIHIQYIWLIHAEINHD